jgi:D-xylose transport system permease protein
MARADIDPPAGPAVEDQTAALEAAAPLVPPEITAQNLGDYVRGQIVRIKSGESGVLPVISALIVLVVVFQIVSPHNVFLTAGNIVNLLQQSAVFIVLGMAEIFVLLLGEIDLSIGFVGPAVGGAITIQLVQPVTTHWPWWGAIGISLFGCLLVGTAWGVFVTKLRLPSFIVTLAGLLIFNGVLLIILAYGPFSGYPSLNGRDGNLRGVYNLMWGHVTPLEGWIVMIVLVAVFSASLFVRDTSRRRSGLVAPPVSLTFIKIAFTAAIGVAVVVICNLNRANIGTLEGVPWFVFIVLGVFIAWTFLLSRTRFGRYVYAIGGNAEAARRAGINVSLIRILAFALCVFTAGIAGILYGAQLGGMSNNVPGGSLVLYAVAAAVIGGTSLFGGRGRMSHAVLGGLMIGVINNGLGLKGLQAQWLFIVTGGVLLFAVIVDALTRRGSTSGSSTRVF